MSRDFREEMIKEGARYKKLVEATAMFMGDKLQVECPICKKSLDRFDALNLPGASRFNSKVKVCSPCSTREALVIGLGAAGETQ